MSTTDTHSKKMIAHGSVACFLALMLGAAGGLASHKYQTAQNVTPQHSLNVTHSHGAIVSNAPSQHHPAPQSLEPLGVEEEERDGEPLARIASLGAALALSDTSYASTTLPAARKEKEEACHHKAHSARAPPKA